ncbi:EAL domain-containing protein [Rheinheimera sp. UJ51]|uniref:putative bifunctional diguanylate cyclase/phosphodiesterase n=1 Tax=Rheinheimera sp. UJ51 TaxID=2892446 RepID=UPI001E628A7D|nr:bifunctional diguanylate cyclase/phosphodiesterase [Rheinheimera sp. UJ51]MCC5452833.1 EAL domain-containing protein [Rheinheimera sp. UJ51]
MMLVSSQQECQTVLNLLTDNLPGFFFQLSETTGQSYQLLKLTNSAAAILGMPLQELHTNQSAIFSRIAAEDFDDLRALLTHSATHGTPWHMQFRYQHPSGNIVWLAAHASLEQDHLGRPSWYGYISDISSMKQNEQALEDYAVAHREILDNVVDAIITINEQGLIQTFNNAAIKLFGYKEEEVLGKNVSMLMPEPYRSQHDHYINAHLHFGVTKIIGRSRETKGQRKDGRLFNMELRISRIERADSVTFIGMVRDLSERKRAEVLIEKLAFYDPLTSLPNRRMLMQCLNDALEKRQYGQELGALLFIDLDNFKHLNDSLGHATGDQLLRQVAQRLQQSVRQQDTVARLGGDEFIILLLHLSPDYYQAIDQAAQIAEKIRAVLNTPFKLEKLSYVSSPSIGITIFSDDNRVVDELLQQADLAMYQAKAAGKNMISLFDVSMQIQASTRTQLESQLRQALSNQQLQLHYQGLHNEQGELVGAEVLIRWFHPELGSVSPAVFIPIAEESGLIYEIGQWVIEQSCLQLTNWTADMPGLVPKLSINISARQFHQENFLPQVLAILEQHPLVQNRLQFELTESILVSRVDEVVAKMRRLQEYGIGFALDDFGTGYSSLSYLKCLPLEQLKIDRSFVEDILHDNNDAAIACTVIALSKALGLGVIAEGVETAEQRDALAGMGCYHYQGFYFSKPLASHDFVNFHRAVFAS